MARASPSAGMLQPVSEEDGAGPPSLHDVKPWDAFAVRSNEYDQIAEILDRVGTVQHNLPQDPADGGVLEGFGLHTVLDDLLGIFSDIGTYGLLFKLASFIKGRVDQMQDVDANAKKLLNLATFIMSSFEKVEIQFTLSNHVILEAAAGTFCHCATVLQRIYRQDQASGCGGKALKWLSKFCSAPADQEQLLECIDMLKEFRQNLLVALQSAPQALALPLVEGPRFGIDDQIEDLLQFFQQSKGGVICVLSICGLKGVGKSRLMFEVMNKFPKSPFESFFTMDCLGAIDGRHLQRELLQHLAGTVREISSIQVGKNLIKMYLEFLKKKSRRVLLAFDNVDKAEDLTSILPLQLSEVLPPGSCVLISLANNATARSAALRGVEDIFPAVARTVHVVPPLKFQDAKMLVAAHARGERPRDEELLDDLVGRCDGLPVLLRLIGSVGFNRAGAWKDWEQVRIELTRVDDNIIPAVTAAVHSMQSGQEDLSQTSRDKLWERLTSKVRIIYGGLDEDLREAISDIGNLFSGWDWQTVECILGTEMMERLEEKSLISSKSSNAQGLTSIANLTRFSGPGPWKTKLVTMDGLFEASAVGQYLYLQTVPGDGTLKNVKSICLKDSDEPITGVMLDRATDLRYLVLHNTKLRGNLVNHLLGLEFLYWGFDKGSEVRFPFDADALPKLRMLMINAKDLDLQSCKVPPTVVQLTLEGCSITGQASEHMLMSKNLKGLRIRKCQDLTGLSPHGQLRKLCLEQCEVPTLPEAIARLRQLTEIELLSCQNLELIGTGTIGALSNLRRLHIIDCRKLKKVAEDLKNLSHLTHLSFAFCSELPGDLNFITGLTKLEELILTGCSSLEKLPSHVGNLQNLEKLNLVACVKLEHLPEDIVRLRELQEMGLDFCSRLKALPRNIAGLPRLQRLTLSCCSQLKELPLGLERLPMLEYLNLLGCRSLVPPTKVIEDLRNKNVVVHVQETDLRTSYRTRPAGEQNFYISTPTTYHPPVASDRRVSSDQGTITSHGTYPVTSA